MNGDVLTALRSILIEEGRVCLPGIGTLLVVGQPALVSLIEGKAKPPSARVDFNANLVVDDGRLEREVPHLPDLKAFLESTRHKLEAGGTVVLEGIGRLYRLSDGEIRFSPMAENFSKDSFGLPAVALKPILRKEKRPANERKRRTPRLPRRSKTAGTELSDRTRRIIWYTTGLVGLVLAIFLLFRIAGLFGTLVGGSDAQVSRDIPAERLNVSPGPTIPAVPPPTVDANQIRPQAPPKHNESPTKIAPATPPPAAPVMNEAIIAIGLYGRQRNVDKQTGRLREAGYTPYTDKEGRNTRVGVRITYREDAELNRALADIRSRYTEDAFVMRVNGEERRPQ
ncbi:hypothetical protein GGR28_000536 [Lewinella aquimaris]|uniref:SPOR domain-containing protein n=1 Tax=Neolewinella aquimaris TaxID=1835722 RepID=A0A840E2M9_9BACT|nr:hypothetical protein [Neolewinella aquimaris]MBB4077935.1 hypothetical protein [Neolewinella aquimaris]